jgi:hypothetical protein
MFTEPLPSNDRRDTQTQRPMGGIYKYTVEMGSGALIFMKIGSGIQKLIGGDLQTRG